MRRGDCIIYIFIIKGCFVVVTSVLGVSSYDICSATRRELGS
jgi:hypothetical protein